MATRVPRRREIVPGPKSLLEGLLERRRGVNPVVERAPHRANQRNQTGRVVPLPDPDAMILTDILDKVRGESRAARVGKYLHVSDLLGKCIRKFSLMHRFDVALPSQRLTLSDSLTFSQGDAIHDVIKARATRGGISMVWGKWSCKCETLKVEEPCTYDDIDHTAVCPACGGEIDRYHEVSMRDEDLYIVGNPDLLLYIRDLDALHVTELKSIAHDAWKELVRPKPDHVLQVTFYWYLMRKLGYTVTDRVSVLYVTKGYMFQGVPYKEFTFDVQSELHRLEPYLEDARAHKAAADGKELPVRTLCAAESSPHARKCEVAKICFGSNTTAPVKVSIRALMSRTRN